MNNRKGNCGIFVKTLIVRLSLFTRCSRLRDELFSFDWVLLLCSAGSFSAIFGEEARQQDLKAAVIGAMDSRLLDCLGAHE